MNEALLQLEPAKVWYYFKEILSIPRPSKKEGKIRAYLKVFGKENNLETIEDETGNILIRKPATAGMENRKPVVLQSHIDMVCEKNSDKQHDFENDPIETSVEEGWVTANGTTLGADDGIGVATQLAILAADDLVHPELECLFTVDEETGLTGAFGLKPDLLKAKILLNLDSEDEGQLFIGCAGGKDTVGRLPFDKVEVPENHTTYKLMVSGLLGGHSGDDINKERGNANKLLNRFLWEYEQTLELKIHDFNGGNLRNAIAREASAIVVVPVNKKELFEIEVAAFERILQAEYHVTEPNLQLKAAAAEMPEWIIDEESQFLFFDLLYVMPHGVIAMSQDIDNFVETSTNMASVKFGEEEIEVTTSQRSSVESKKEDIVNMVNSVFQLAGARAESSDGYPGWTPNPNSEIVAITNDLYRKLFHAKPEVLAIHAGLECGLIGDTYPAMDMISFGPTIKGAHSPNERIEIASVQKFWDLTIEVLKNIPEK